MNIASNLPVQILPGRSMTPTQYRTACTKLAISLRQSATLLDLSEKQVYRFANGRAPIPVTVAIALRAMVRLGTIEV
jgi:predicted transcriptional regulator